MSILTDSSTTETISVKFIRITYSDGSGSVLCDSGWASRLRTNSTMVRVEWYDRENLDVRNPTEYANSHVVTVDHVTPWTKIEKGAETPRLCEEKP